MMTLVVNASPLILLCKVGMQDILRRLCGTIYVPEGVIAEIRVEQEDAAARFLGYCDWLVPVKTTVPDSIKAWDLGRGESEVLAYALQENMRPLLDDAEGKACALALGLKPLGTGGLLILAKKAGLLESVDKVLLELRSEGLWISEPVRQILLRSAGES